MLVWPQMTDVKQGSETFNVWPFRVTPLDKHTHPLAKFMANPIGTLRKTHSLFTIPMK